MLVLFIRSKRMVENRCFVLRACVNHYNANVADSLQAVRRVFQEAVSEQHTMARDSTKRHLRLKKNRRESVF